MISRYFKLKPFIDTTDGDLVLLLPSAGEDFETRKLFYSLQKFEDVSLTLQTEFGLNLSEARALYPDLSYYLGLDHSSNQSIKNLKWRYALRIQDYPSLPNKKIYCKEFCLSTLKK